ncbi:MAG: signal peptidase II [Bacilli bacterium]|nr:signal peptidase II [Bacilli bacterium]MDD3895411.1 signal peptidase II [Bacilli bacterium]MDD4407622.1 signal peptidase II [Bacilli bacterium]
MNKKILIYASIILFLDQISKILVDLYLSINDSFPVIKNFFHITYINNYGAAFGILNNKLWLLIIFTLLAFFIIYRYINTFKINKRNEIAFSFLLGGILGNLIDRLFLGYIRDFLDFNIFGYNFPVFNLGDSFIFLGAILLIIAIYKGEDNANSSKSR